MNERSVSGVWLSISDEPTVEELLDVARALKAHGIIEGDTETEDAREAVKAYLEKIKTLTKETNDDERS